VPSGVSRTALLTLCVRQFRQAELGAPGGLAYELSFNSYGLRISLLGLSQNIGSYARRLCRRLVAHQSRLLEGPERLPSVVIDTAIRNVNRSPLSSRRKKLLADAIREASAVDAAVEGVSFFKSCSGGVCFSQEDLLPKETVALLGDLKVIFRSVTGSNVRPVPAAPELEALLYRAAWKPRSASSCSVSGAILISDACGRVSR
jgi:hypothetical protein